MAHKQVLFRAEAREKVLRGVDALADAVRVTLGPRSRSVLIERPWGRPLVCNDGVTIAKEMSLADPVENLGAQLMREAAERTGDAVGDGTSTSTVLARAVFAEGLRNVTAGASAVDLRTGLERGTRCAVESLRALSRPVKSREEKVQVATISAHNDATIGAMVGDAVDRIGGEGVITVEEAEGIVPGGGLALLRAADAVRREAEAAEGDVATGLRILARALESPARQIAENSGVDGGVVVDRMRSGTGAHGFDAARCEYVDLIEAGIVDPTKVVRVALENAVSVAFVLLLTEATLTAVPEKGKTPEAAGLE